MREIEHNGCVILTNDKRLTADELTEVNKLDKLKEIKNRMENIKENMSTRERIDCLILSIEELMELSIEANKTFEEFQKIASKIVDKEKAEYIRFLRTGGIKGNVEGNMASWRKIARICHDEFKGDWNPPNNQLMGMALCEAAAKFFNEDYEKEPWN